MIPRSEGGAVPARVYRAAEPFGANGALVWFHGGGWVAGNLDGFDRVARRLANACGMTCVSVDYRLAPEHPFPAAVEDADAAVAWATGEGARLLGTDPLRVVVGGDSAGGHLAALAVQRARDGVRGQLFVYPALDPATDSDAYRRYAEGPMLTARDMRACWDAYLGDGGDAAGARVLEGGLTGLPPAWLVIAEHDPLRDDGLNYAAALRSAGVPAETVVYDDMTHGFLRWGGIVERADQAITWLAAAARASLS